MTNESIEQRTREKEVSYGILYRMRGAKKGVFHTSGNTTRGDYEGAIKKLQDDGYYIIRAYFNLTKKQDIIFTELDENRGKGEDEGRIPEGKLRGLVASLGEKNVDIRGSLKERIAVERKRESNIDFVRDVVSSEEDGEDE